MLGCGRFGRLMIAIDLGIQYWYKNISGKFVITSYSSKQLRYTLQNGTFMLHTSIYTSSSFYSNACYVVSSYGFHQILSFKAKIILLVYTVIESIAVSLIAAVHCWLIISKQIFYTS